tara:strand:+ start:133 stop:756 length:624 start_codon:yes stop_codon:yes gene_type:complete
MASVNQKTHYRNGIAMLRLYSRGYYDQAFLPTCPKLKKRFEKYGTKALNIREKRVGQYLTIYDIDFLFPCKKPDGTPLTLVNAFTYYAKTCHFQHRKTTDRIKHKYGLTRIEYDSMMTRPCEACGTTKKQFLDTKKRWKKNFKNHAVDHNHETGQVRGALCFRCNVSLGYMEDNPDKILALFAYLVDKDNSIDYNNKIEKIMEVINE